METQPLIMITQDNLSELAEALAPQVKQKEWLTEKEAADYLGIKV